MMMTNALQGGSSPSGLSGLMGRQQAVPSQGVGPKGASIAETMGANSGVPADFAKALATMQTQEDSKSGSSTILSSQEQSVAEEGLAKKELSKDLKTQDLTKGEFRTEKRALKPELMKSTLVLHNEPQGEKPNSVTLKQGEKQEPVALVSSLANESLDGFDPTVSKKVERSKRDGAADETAAAALPMGLMSSIESRSAVGKAVEKQSTSGEDAALALNPSNQLRHPALMGHGLVKPTAAKTGQQALGSANDVKQASVLNSGPGGAGDVATTKKSDSKKAGEPFAKWNADVIEVAAPETQTTVAQTNKGSSGFSSSEQFLSDRRLAEQAVPALKDKFKGLKSGVKGPEQDLLTGQQNQLSAIQGAGASAVASQHALSMNGNNTGIAQLAGLSQGPTELKRSVDLTQPMAVTAAIRDIASTGGGSVKVRVVPDNLGEMTISVKNRGSGKLDIQFDVQSSDAREMLLSQVTDLKRSLATSNFSVGVVEVNAAKSQSSSFAGNIGNMSVVGSNSTSSTSSTVQDLSQWNAQQGLSDRSQSGQGGSAWERYQSQYEARYGEMAG